jgi:hypothetical protein
MPKVAVQQTADRLAYIKVHTDVTGVIFNLVRHLGRPAFGLVGKHRTGVGDAEHDMFARIGALQQYGTFASKV